MITLSKINNRLFRLMATLIISMFLLNTVASFLYWYNEIWWFDMFMHALGGAWVMTLLLSLRIFFPRSLNSQSTDFFVISSRTVIVSFFLLLSILSGWEGFEYVVQFYTNSSFANPIDSTSDIILGLGGGLLCLFILIRRRIVLW